nr:immunoglobulin light chain junction region [Mus musculus]NSL97632.1 immunoglobulin light chain junction region [Mus musculus]NSL98593.1 immunoglobulin light chain junction region [Mus musculus]NSM00769.1 immunoglobulin light chain junction region [Mus musculus]NSM01065.1 immunoglobulin light chain junction region [Mus musculus]
CQQGNTLPFTF